MLQIQRIGWKILKDPDNLWVTVVSAKYLTKKNFMEVRKATNASRMWKHILDHRYLLKKGISWCLGDGNNINFWQDNWMPESPLIKKVPLERRSVVNMEDKVSKYINRSHGWQLMELRGLLPDDIITKSENIPIPVMDVRDKIIWKYNTDGSFTIKTATWANNDRIPLHSKAKLLNHIQKLKTVPKIKLFLWKLIRVKLPTRGYLNGIGLDINADCHFCNNYIEDIDNLFKNCELTRQVWKTISDYCLNSDDSNMHFIDQIEFVYRNEKSYDISFGRPLEKIVVIAWFIWTHMNNAIFNNWKVNPAQVINLAAFIFQDMKYYNVLSDLFEQDITSTTRRNSSRSILTHHASFSSDKGWIKINTDASRRYDLQSTTIAYIIIDTDGSVLRTLSKKLGDSPILVAECEAVPLCYLTNHYDWQPEGLD